MLPSGERELSKAHFGSTVPGKTQRILEVLSPENRLSRASATAFWKYWPNFTFFYFSGYSTSILLFFRSTESPERILEVLFPEKRRRESSAYRGWALQRLSRASAPALAQFYLFYFSGYSTSIFLFFRSTESPGKTRSVFTPPLA